MTKHKKKIFPAPTLQVIFPSPAPCNIINFAQKNVKGAICCLLGKKFISSTLLPEQSFSSPHHKREIIGVKLLYLSLLSLAWFPICEEGSLIQLDRDDWEQWPGLLHLKHRKYVLFHCLPGGSVSIAVDSCTLYSNITYTPAQEP